ncbi:hypothetical protein F5Y12DRAFT_727918 [Xylaria sp. FL1777]|nr:hypothetical protein F5Y12DRAFT_727918 [Xylaria sp. FL1777]
MVPTCVKMGLPLLAARFSLILRGRPSRLQTKKGSLVVPVGVFCCRVVSGMLPRFGHVYRLCRDTGDSLLSGWALDSPVLTYAGPSANV